MSRLQEEVVLAVEAETVQAVECEAQAREEVVHQVVQVLLVSPSDLQTKKQEQLTFSKEADHLHREEILLVLPHRARKN